QTAGRYEPAQKHYEDALAMNERLYGRRHLAVAKSLEELGHLQKMRGDYKSAEKMLRESLELLTALDGTKSTRLPIGRNELAQVMKLRGDAKGGEDLFRRALALDRAANNELHVAYESHNLAVVLQGRGAFDEARPLFEESTALLKRVMGDK